MCCGETGTVTNTRNCSLMTAACASTTLSPRFAGRADERQLACCFTEWPLASHRVQHVGKVPRPRCCPESTPGWTAGPARTRRSASRTHAGVVLPSATCHACLSSMIVCLSVHQAAVTHLQEVGQHWIDDVHTRDSGAVFKMGFHAIPSMNRLHLHVISQVRSYWFDRFHI